VTYMRRSVAALMAALLLAGVSVPAFAEADTSNGVVTPVVTTTEIENAYTALEVETKRSTGKAETNNYDFTVKANQATLTVENDGITELDVAINGQRLHLNTFFDKGEGKVTLDISEYTKYGANQLEVQSLGKPNTTAKLTVEAPVFTARVLHTNDIHAAIDNLPKMAAYVKAAKAVEGENVYFVDAGDNFSGNPVSDLNAGKPMIEALNGMQVDLSIMGNHDFDHGPANTQARREESNFPWLSANAIVADQSLTPIQPFDGYLIKENELGQRIGFIALTQTPPATGTKNIVGFRFEDPVGHARRLIAELRDQVNVLVVVSHNGHDWDTANAAALQGADLILGAHSHTSLTKPVVEAGIPIIQVGSGAANISNLLVTQTDKVEVTAGATGGKYVVSTASMTAVDPEVQATVTKWKDEMAPILNDKIGYNNTALTSGGSKSSSDIGLGNLIADGLAYYMEADIAVWNNGGIRADLPKGDITMNAIYKVLPFGNVPWKVQATGAQLTEFFGKSFSRQDRNVIDLQVGGGSYTIYTKADGSLDRVALKIAGEPVDPDKLYTLAVSDYIATHTEYWGTIPTPVEMSSEVDAIAVAEYVKHIGTVNYKSGSNGRIKIVAPSVPKAVSKLNFYNSSSLLAADETGALVPLTNQAEVLVTAEATGFQEDRYTEVGKNFPMVDAGQPVPLVALQTVGNGKVFASGGMLVANGYRANYENPQYFTNVLDYLTGSANGTVLFDEGHGQYYNAGGLSQISAFIEARGYTASFTGEHKALTADRLKNVKVLVITTPDSVGTFTDAELTVLTSYVAGGGNLILLSQTDYNNNSNPTELNRIAAAIGSVIRFNSDEVRDNTSKDGSTNYSPVTNEFNPNYAELLKVR
jgi:2',3'-cyclic-nucleotide 2'-phosphodiesterase (5'-nucleotidase family)